jgi:hypothetical protein
MTEQQPLESIEYTKKIDGQIYPDWSKIIPKIEEQIYQVSPVSRSEMGDIVLSRFDWASDVYASDSSFLSSLSKGLIKHSELNWKSSNGSYYVAPDKSMNEAFESTGEAIADAAKAMGVKPNIRVEDVSPDAHHEKANFDGDELDQPDKIYFAADRKLEQIKQTVDQLFAWQMAITVALGLILAFEITGVWS